MSSYSERELLEWFNHAPSSSDLNLRYPFLFILLPSILMKVFHLDVIEVYRVFSIFVSFLLFYCLHLFYNNFLRSHKKAFLCIGVFLLSSGFNYLKWIVKFFEDPSILNTNHLFQYHPSVASTFMYSLFPSRSLCGGLIFSTLAILCLERISNKKYFAFSCLLSLCSFFTYPHSLILIFLYSVCSLFKKKNIKEWVVFGMINTAFVSAYSFLYLSHPDIIITIDFSPLWFVSGLSLSEGSIYIVREFGIFYFLIAFILIKNRTLGTLDIIGLATLTLYAFFIMQPNPYDNARILILSKLCFSVSLVNFLIEKSKKKMLVILLSVLLFADPIINYIETIVPNRVSYPFLTRSDYELSAFIKSNTLLDDVFLTDSRRNNPISLLAGRGKFLGNRHYLWSLGYNYTIKEKVVNEIYEGGDGVLRIAKDHGIDYIVFSKYELLAPEMVKKFGHQDNFETRPRRMNIEFYKNNFNTFYESERYLIFKL
ncbi:hypothetical protein [Halobacteriovorax sp. HLS]|uniref:hypothetical protein n=1 Tax=Halobacteriovorax sp. HLS TaxID=2234000 RepID=UPI000FDC1211|nr:hypothetical protein [Halobacteriovorax sp. HLS]